MEPTRILPDLQCSLLCEDVRQESNGNFILVGVIGFLRVPQIPITVLKICIFNRWTAGVGSFTETVRLVGPDQTTVIRKSQVKFSLREASSHATNVSLFGQVGFREAGVHFVEIIVEEVMKLRFPFVIKAAPPPDNPPPTASGTPPQAPSGER